ARASLKDAVDSVNAETAEIADLNGRIATASLQGIQANDLSDRRDQLIDQLASQLNVRVTDTPNGQRTVLAAGIPLVVGTQAQAVQLGTDADGKLGLFAVGGTAPLSVQGGQIGGLLDVVDTHLPAVQDGLDQIAAAVAQNVDAVHATGLSPSGANTF